MIARRLLPLLLQSTLLALACLAGLLIVAQAVRLWPAFALSSAKRSW